MDPNTALDGARKATADIFAAQDHEVSEAAAELAGAFTALDEWLTKGGFLPDAWHRPLVPAFGVNPNIDQLLFDVFVTAVEGGINDWAACERYRNCKDDRFTDDLEGFYVDIIDTDYERNDPDAEFPPTRIDRAVMAKAFERVTAGPIEGWHESYRNKFLTMLNARLAGFDDSPADSNYDAYDSQGLVQVGMFGKVIFG